MEVAVFAGDRSFSHEISVLVEGDPPWRREGGEEGGRGRGVRGGAVAPGTGSHVQGGTLTC